MPDSFAVDGRGMVHYAPRGLGLSDYYYCCCYSEIVFDKQQVEYQFG